MATTGRVPIHRQERPGAYSNSTAKLRSRNGGKSDSGRPVSHATLAFDTKGRLFVADRGNNRIQIFNQDGSSSILTSSLAALANFLSLPTTPFTQSIRNLSPKLGQVGKQAFGSETPRRIERPPIPPHPSQTLVRRRRWRRRSCRRRWQCLCRRRPGLSQSCQGGITKHAEAASLTGPEARQWRALMLDYLL